MCQFLHLFYLNLDKIDEDAIVLGLSCAIMCTRYRCEGDGMFKIVHNRV